jgi:hypothetical protein
MRAYWPEMLAIALVILLVGAGLLSYDPKEDGLFTLKPFVYLFASGVVLAAAVISYAGSSAQVRQKRRERADEARAEAVAAHLHAWVQVSAARKMVASYRAFGALVNPIPNPNLNELGECVRAVVSDRVLLKSTTDEIRNQIVTLLTTFNGYAASIANGNDPGNDEFLDAMKDSVFGLLRTLHSQIDLLEPGTSHYRRPEWGVEEDDANLAPPSR